MAKSLIIFFIFVAVVNFGRGLDLLRTKRQATDNENADINLTERHGVMPGGHWHHSHRSCSHRHRGQHTRPTSTTTTTTTSTTTERSTGDPDSNFQRCMRNCPVTSEYNPVCGSDNARYENPSWLSCAQACGANVTMVSPAPCRPTAAPSQ